MTREEAITVMQLYKDELEHRIAIAKIDYDPGAIDLYSIQLDAFDVATEALSAEAVSREEYEETDGVVTIEKQNVNEVGEIKHIVIHSPNYTRYFYNESMPLPAEAVHKPDYSYEADMVRRLKEALSAEAEQRWIPCSERLPSEDGQYLVCMDSGQMNVYVWAEGWNCIRLLNGMVTREYEIDGIVAWMPLPEPYTEMEP